MQEVKRKHYKNIIFFGARLVCFGMYFIFITALNSRFQNNLNDEVLHLLILNLNVNISLDVMCEPHYKGNLFMIKIT